MKEYLGLGSASTLNHLLKNKKGIFLVTGKRAFDKSGIDYYLKNFSGPITGFSEFGPLVTRGDLEIGKKHFEEAKRNCDVVVAVGGGKAIDMAKLIRFETKQRVTLIAIPTTSGSGSEATHFAVIYEDGIKKSIADKTILPDYAIVDPALAYSVSPHQRAVSGMDALTQAIESFWSKKATKESKQYSFDAVTLLYPNLKSAVGGDKKAMSKVALGAHLAGKAINIAKTTVCHALSYYFTYNHNIPHGYAVALTLPFAIEFNCKDKDMYFNMKPIFHHLGAITAKDASDNIALLMSEIGLNPVHEAINEINVKKAIKQVNEERLSNNPVMITKQNKVGQLRQLFRYE